MISEHAISTSEPRAVHSGVNEGEIDSSAAAGGRLASLRFISRLTTCLVIALGLGSFALSFEALLGFAASTGSVAPGRAWIFPLIVDGSIVVFSVSALRCSLVGEDIRWSMAMVVIVTVASVVFNIAHASGGFLTALTSATPPLLLFLSFESLMRQLRSQLGPLSHRVNEPSMGPEKQRKPSKRAGDATTPAKLSSETRDREIRKLLLEGKSKRAVARTLGVSPNTVRRFAA